MTSDFSVRDIALCAIMAALMFASQVAMASLPNIHIVALLIILTVQLIGAKALCSVAVFVLLEGLFYGFASWWFGYLLAWPLLALVALIFKDSSSPLFWAVVTGLHGIFFGLICAIPQIFILGLKVAIAWFISGIPFDLIHCAGNFVLALVLFKPLYNIIQRYTKSTAA